MRQGAAAAGRRLTELLDIDEVQARAVLDMQLRKLAVLERQQRADDYQGAMAKIAECESILASRGRQRQPAAAELTRLARATGNSDR